MPKPQHDYQHEIHVLADATTFAAIWAKYERLCELREEAHEVAAGSTKCTSCVGKLPGAMKRFVDQIDSSLSELAQIAVDKPARTRGDIECKSKILTDCIAHHSSELVTALAESLQNDVTRQT